MTTAKRVEAARLLQKLRRGDERPGETQLRALRELDSMCEHPWAVCDAQGPYCQACGLPWSKVLEQEKEATR